MYLTKHYTKLSALIVISVIISCSKEVPNASDKALTNSLPTKTISNNSNKSSINIKKNSFKISNNPDFLFYGNNWSEITEPSATKGFYVLFTPDNLVENNESTWLSTKFGAWNEISDTNASGSSYITGKLLENDSNTLNYQPRAWNLVTDPNASGQSYSEIAGSVASFSVSDTVFENNPATPKLLYNKGAINWVHHITSPDTVSYNDSQPLVILANSKSVKYIGNGCKYTSDKQYLYNKNTKSSYIEVSFTSTNIELWGTQGKNFGKVKVTIFDENNNIEKVIDNIDRYSKTKKISIITKVQGLKQSKHKARIESTATKHNFSSGLTFDFNKALIYPSVQFTFSGTGIKYYAWIANTYGKVDIGAYGGTPERADLYANNQPKYSKCPSRYDDDYRERERNRDKDDMDDDYKTKSHDRNNLNDRYEHRGERDDRGNDDYERCTEIVNKNVIPVSKMIKEYSGLTDSEHIITIEGTGDKNSLSKGFTINLDKFENALSTDVGGSVPSVSGTFNGETMGLRVVKGPKYGLMDVFVDDNLSQTIDLYSPTYTFETIPVNASSFNLQGLKEDDELMFGANHDDEALYHYNVNSFDAKACYDYCPPDEGTTHSFKLVAKNEKNPESSGNMINFDAAVFSKIVFNTYIEGNIINTGLIEIYSIKGPD